ncbi:MAG: histidine phosphatase family protein [Planktomarina sp.]
MTQITLIRHGQANFGAKTEEGYDKLSPLGHQQAEWLGEYMRATGAVFDHVHHGTLRRQRETAEGMNLGLTRSEDARLNEIKYLHMATAFNQQSGMTMPETGKEFAAHVPHLFNAWAAGDLDHVHPTYTDFAQQMTDVVGEALAMGGHHVFVTSGGVIGMMIAQLLALPPSGYAAMMLPIRNTSIHRFGIAERGLYLEEYNMTPHLDHANRANARTYV